MAFPSHTQGLPLLIRVYNLSVVQKRSQNLFSELSIIEVFNGSLH